MAHIRQKIAFCLSRVLGRSGGLGQRRVAFLQAGQQFIAGFLPGDLPQARQMHGQLRGLLQAVAEFKPAAVLVIDRGTRRLPPGAIGQTCALKLKTQPFAVCIGDGQKPHPRAAAMATQPTAEFRGRPGDPCGRWLGRVQRAHHQVDLLPRRQQLLDGLQGLRVEGNYFSHFMTTQPASS